MGYGKRITKKLRAGGIRTVLDLVRADPVALRSQFCVTLEKTLLELRGTPCMEIDDDPAPRQQILVSRSFGMPITDILDTGCHNSITAPMTEIRIAPEATSATAQDDPYYYRVDAALSLRKMQRASVFLPVRWDADPRQFRHASLVSAQSTLADGDGIFRMSFWQRRDTGDRDLRRRGSCDSHILLRVKRHTVARALVDWRIEEDDGLPGEADLIWAVRRVDDPDDGFSTVGVPLCEFEVFDPASGHWHSWYDAPALLPDHVRLPAAGWFPVVLRTTHGAGLGYWKVLRAHLASGPAFWLLLTLDDTSRGTLGSQDEAVAAALSPVVLDSLGELHHRELGVLTISPTNDKAWLEELTLTWASSRASTWWSRLWRRADEPSSAVLHAHRHSYVTRTELNELVKRSGLPRIKPEFPARAWSGN